MSSLYSIQMNIDTISNFSKRRWRYNAKLAGGSTPIVIIAYTSKGVVCLHSIAHLSLSTRRGIRLSVRKIHSDTNVASLGHTVIEGHVGLICKLDTLG